MFFPFKKVYYQSKECSFSEAGGGGQIFFFKRWQPSSINGGIPATDRVFSLLFWVKRLFEPVYCFKLHVICIYLDISHILRQCLK